MTTQILNTTNTHSDSIVEILAEAFNTDPVFNWICDDSRYSKFAFEKVLPAFSSHNHTYISEEENGAAIWLPPGVEFPITAGIPIIWSHFYNFGFGTASRFVKALSVVDEYHYKPPHYYLFAIGVKDTAKGKGIGSALLKTVTLRCDEEQMPSYLENSNEQNLGLYERHGYEVIQEVNLPDGPTIWPMLRQPREINTI